MRSVQSYIANLRRDSADSQSLIRHAICAKERNVLSGSVLEHYVFDKSQTHRPPPACC